MIDVTVKMLWSSDWDGEDVGYPNSLIVSLYTTENEEGKILYLYVDVKSNKILDFWIDEEE